jgi:hypothetical protein
MEAESGTVSEHHTTPIVGVASSTSDDAGERQLARWGGAVGLGGVALMLLTFTVVIGMDLPDASDAETLTDFADIETGRIVEHLLYLGALILFTLHLAVLYQLLKTAHWPAALFGTALSTIGLIIMSASSLLHVSTSPLADLYTDPTTPPEELSSIEYAWRGAQSVFDSMLATGLVLVPIGMVLLGVAMRRSPRFGPRLAWLSIGLAAIGVVGATAEIIDQALEFSAASVLAIVVFQAATGWRTLRLGRSDDAAASTREQTTTRTRAR